MKQRVDEDRTEQVPKSARKASREVVAEHKKEGRKEEEALAKVQMMAARVGQKQKRRGSKRQDSVLALLLVRE